MTKARFFLGHPIHTLLQTNGNRTGPFYQLEISDKFRDTGYRMNIVLTLYYLCIVIVFTPMTISFPASTRLAAFKTLGFPNTEIFGMGGGVIQLFAFTGKFVVGDDESIFLNNLLNNQIIYFPRQDMQDRHSEKGKNISVGILNH